MAWKLSAWPHCVEQKVLFGIGTGAFRAMTLLCLVTVAVCPRDREWHCFMA